VGRLVVLALLAAAACGAAPRAARRERATGVGAAADPDPDSDPDGGRAAGPLPVPGLGRGRVVVTSSVDYILDRIYFRPGDAAPRPESLPIVDAIATTLLGNPDILLVEVAGHSDAREGDPQLSRRRAEVVAAELVRRGVDPARLRPVGYGASHPIDPRTDELAFERNRRIELRILQRK